MINEGRTCFSLAFYDEIKVIKEDSEHDTELIEILKQDSNKNNDNTMQTDLMVKKLTTKSKTKDAARVIKLGLLSFFNR